MCKIYCYHFLCVCVCVCVNVHVCVCVVRAYRPEEGVKWQIIVSCLRDYSLRSEPSFQPK